jgi:site-specific DNA recombinase
MSKHTPRATVPVVRCAIYTRKSTDEGLDQDFNSLDVQRESGEAYIKSQAHEGWTCLPDRYDDGGFTGGNMERPALRRLLADIEAGKIDRVVVYKVDRLSRSLLDFAKMMETFEKHQVSFVSVTQQFNTASSMGRLVLNVLLSFAQFEREIISERTRDKIAAARRKGKSAGGHPILGYDIDPRGFKLIVNEDEAIRVRAIFELYLEHQALLPVVQELDRRGWVNKRWTTRKGRERGGKPFSKTSLHKLLTNVAYIGKVRYKNEVHDGEHAAIQVTAKSHQALDILYFRCTIRSWKPNPEQLRSFNGLKVRFGSCCCVLPAKAITNR